MNEKEKFLRRLGSSGLYRGHWDLLKIVEACETGVPLRAALIAVAEDNGISPEAERKRIRSLIRHMEKGACGEWNETFGGESPNVERLAARLLQRD